MADTTLLNGFQSSRELWNKKSKTVIMKFRFNLEYRSCWNSLISETFKYCSIPLTLLYFYYCFINYIAKSEDEDNSMLGCSNSLCSHGLFFHLACVGLWRAPGAMEDWWCSAECEATGSSAFCFCGRNKPREVLVECSADSCTGAGVYHLGCLDLDDEPGN